VALIIEAIARHAGARPAIFDSCESAFVERNRPSRGLTSANDTIVSLNQNRERANGQEDPPTGHESGPGKPHGQHDKGKGGETSLTEAQVQPGQRVVRRSTLAEAVAIVIGW